MEECDMRRCVKFTNLRNGSFSKEFLSLSKELRQLQKKPQNI